MLYKKIALGAVMTALALALQYIESFIPLSVIVPVPGIKLGLSNIITISALYTLGFLPALLITLAKCFLGSMYGFGITGFFYSFAGGLLSLFIMTALKKFFPRTISIYGVSIAGAAAHNTGQIITAALFMSSITVFIYLPLLLTASVFTGILTAFCASKISALFNISKK